MFERLEGPVAASTAPILHTAPGAKPCP